MAGSSFNDFLCGLPKAELHMHIEGSLEPELLFELAERNRVDLPYASIEEVRRAYAFEDLQSFLDLYYQATAVLQRADDFYDLTWRYLERCRTESVVHTEIFFDPQAHTDRGIAFDAVLQGITAALDDARRQWGQSSGLIMCFLRHLGPAHALETLEAALPYRERLIGVGLDSTEVGFPPEDFAEVYRRAAALGLRLVAHAGEEGPPEYIRQALDVLNVERIDHGVRVLEDEALMRRVAAARIPLTVCPLSNVKLRVFPDLESHTILRLLDAGLAVTVNSDDPAYFGGYLNANFTGLAAALDMTKAQALQMARNSFEASFIEPDARAAFLWELDAYSG
jgi:adenosine deaminase